MNLATHPSALPPPHPIPRVERPAFPKPDDATPAALEFALLEAWLASSAALRLPLHQIESQQESKGREVQRLLLQAHLQQRAYGDVGPALRVQQDGGQLLYTHRRIRTRCLKTIFGPVQIARMGYCRPGASTIYPLDQTLVLPERSFSYELQRRLIRAAVHNPFHESVEAIAELTGVAVPKRSLENILRDAARDFDAFYQERIPEPATGSILVAAIDGKGIPMIKPEGEQPSARRTKGKKANRKRMATVAAVFTRAPWVRTPEQVVKNLFHLCGSAAGDRQTPPHPENKRVWASLLKGKTAVIQEVAQEMLRRDPGGSKTRVAITDGERALQILVEQKLGITLVLDLLHVLEKLWKAAYMFHPEGSLEAELWVADRALRILFGEVSQVVKGLRQSITKRRLSGAKRKTLSDVANYLYRNRRRMRYDEYLAQGLPIASGPVEGACKNLIKDRMERSGMRWTEGMAEAIVQLRAIYLSGDFDRYWSFHIEKDQSRLYPNHWSVATK
jgi:hypothetical protein